MDGANVVFRVARAISDIEVRCHARIGHTYRGHNYISDTKVRDATRDVTQNETAAVLARLGMASMDCSVPSPTC